MMLESSKESFKATLLEQSEARKLKIAELSLNFKESGPFSSKWKAAGLLFFIIYFLWDVLVLSCTDV